MYYNRKKELIKNIILITAIFALAIISTYYIYNRFDNSEVVYYTSESLDITYKEDNGDKIAITNVTPVTDSVGLSTPAHTVTVKNNLLRHNVMKLSMHIFGYLLEKIKQE